MQMKLWKKKSIFVSFQVFALAQKRIGGRNKNLEKCMSNLNLLNRRDHMPIYYLPTFL